MKRLLTRISLTVSGALLGLIGSALVFAPQSFLAMNDVLVEHDPGLMSELAAPGGVLLIASALMIYGAIRISFSPLALSIGALVYGSYGVGRLFSIMLNGLPSDALIAATVIEIVVAAALSGLWLNGWVRQKRRLVKDGFDNGFQHMRRVA